MGTLASMIDAALDRRGDARSRGPGEIEIVYVEGMGLDGRANGDRPNEWNDLRVVLRHEDGEPKIVGAWDATTEPGVYYTRRPVNPAGAARIEFGQYRAWQVGAHRGDHEALRQSGGPVRVRRDANKDMIRSGDALDEGWFGINQHWGYDQPEDDIGKASAGCLVGRTREGHREFMALVKSDPRYRADPDFVFSTSVLAESDVLAEAGPRPEPEGTALRRRMARAIVDFEARRDRRGRLAVYALPADDGGGSYEVAGINSRYHPREARALRALIQAGRYDEAERRVRDYLLDYTDVVADWYPPGDPGVEFFLRDCAFNRGPSGAARILQRAVGVREDGVVGDAETRPAAGALPPLALLGRLRDARESYERSPVGRDEGSTFWRGLEKRWDKALALAEAFSAGADESSEPDSVDVDSVLAAIAAAIRPILEEKMNLPVSYDPRTVSAFEEFMRRQRERENESELLSPIDRALGGRTGWKTATGLVGAISTLIGAKVTGSVDPGAAAHADVVIELIVGLFGLLGGAGLLAKADRALKTVGRLLVVASEVRDRLDGVVDRRLADHQ